MIEKDLWSKDSKITNLTKIANGKEIVKEVKDEEGKNNASAS